MLATVLPMMPPPMMTKSRASLRIPIIWLNSLMAAGRPMTLILSPAWSIRSSSTIRISLPR